MPRLRATTTLSLLALVSGILGTQWLCTLTDDWTGPRMSGSTAIAHPTHRATSHRRTHAAPRIVGAMVEARMAAGSSPDPEPPSLVPLSTPPDPAPYASVRGHLDGHLVLNIATDRSGRVTFVGIARSSGDSVLDAHALATVRHWRFAVPPGGEGVQGELPMRFDSTAPATPP